MLFTCGWHKSLGDKDRVYLCCFVLLICNSSDKTLMNQGEKRQSEEEGSTISDLTYAEITAPGSREEPSLSSCYTILASRDLET